jgi:hypothetical protein
MKPFDYVNSILRTKEYLITDSLSEREYNPFLANRALSYHTDTLIHAQQMNLLASLDKKMQYDYLINSIRPKYRKMSKWSKPKREDDIPLIMEYYNYSLKKAIAAIQILSESELETIKIKMNKGIKNE